MATKTLPEFKLLATDIQADVCIVGAGISGLSCAYELTQQGRSVVIIDDGPIVSGETERTTAHLANAMDDRFYVLEQMHGEAGARIAGASHGAAIDRIEQICMREQIQCDFHRVDGYLFLGKGDDRSTLEKELDAAHRAGLSRVELLVKAPVRSFDTGPCLRFPRQGQFHPTKYFDGVTAAILKAGGRIYTQTRALEISDGSPVEVRTQGGATIRASVVVVATNTPVKDRFRIHTKQAPYRTYVIGARVAKDSVPLGLYWDTEDPYHYIRLEANNDAQRPYDMLIVGGADHKTGQEDKPQESWDELEEWTRARFPVQIVEYRWSGQVMEPVDGMAFIGRNPGDRNVYIATGDSGQGMTHGTIAGMLITDLIQGRENPWECLYDPSRKATRSLKEFARENLNVAAQYRDYVTPGDVPSEFHVAKGEGCIVRHGAKKVAVYCDDSGQRHEFSAVCPHLGCIVSWNTAEKTWDCPCHGSRFTKMGEVVNGPAKTNLARVKG